MVENSFKGVDLVLLLFLEDASVIEFTERCVLKIKG